MLQHCLARYYNYIVNHKKCISIYIHMYQLSVMLTIWLLEMAVLRKTNRKEIQ